MDHPSFIVSSSVTIVVTLRNLFRLIPTTRTTPTSIPHCIHHRLTQRPRLLAPAHTYYDVREWTCMAFNICGCGKAGGMLTPEASRRITYGGRHVR